MKKKIIIILILIGSLGLFLFIKTALKTKKAGVTPEIPPPSYFTQPTIIPTRRPNILPQDIIEQERRFLEQTPILQKLPARSTFFSVEYVDERHLIVHAKTDNKNRDYEQARGWFSENAIDTRNIVIEYK